jgi:hypothetical protein
MARKICDQWGYVWDGDPEDNQTAPETNIDYDERPSKKLYREAARAALSALEAAGLVIVPVVPTEAMVDAAIIADRPALGRITVGDVLKAEYTAMVKAALNPERDSSG